MRPSYRASPYVLPNARDRRTPPASPMVVAHFEIGGRGRGLSRGAGDGPRRRGETRRPVVADGPAVAGGGRRAVCHGVAADGLVLGASSGRARSTDGPAHNLHAYFVGHLGKYVPGKALVLVIRVSLLKPRMITIRLGAASIMLETLMLMSVGAVLAAVLSTFVLRRRSAAGDCGHDHRAGRGSADHPADHAAARASAHRSADRRDSRRIERRATRR